jgi:hypothetical protein
LGADEGDTAGVGNEGALDRPADLADAADDLAELGELLRAWG